MDKRIYTLTFITFLVGLSELIIGGLLPLIATDLKITLGQTGLLITAFSFTFALSGPTLLLLTSSFNRTRLITATLGLFSLSNFFVYISSSLTTILVARMGSAMVAALLISLCLTIATQISKPKNRSKSIGLVLMGVSASLVLGVPIGLILSDEWGWRSPFLIIFILSALLMFIFWKVAPDMGSSNSNKRTSTMKFIIDKKILSIQAISILFYIANLTFYAYLSPFLEKSLNLSSFQISVAYMLFGASSVFGSWLGGYLADRYGETLMIITFTAMYLSLYMLMMISIHSPLLVMIYLMIWSALSWALTPAVQSLLISVAPESSDIQQSINNSNIHIGMAVGAFVGGYVLDTHAIEYTLLAGAIFSLFALCVSIFTHNMIKPRMHLLEDRKDEKN